MQGFLVLKIAYDGEFQGKNSPIYRLLEAPKHSIFCLFLLPILQILHLFLACKGIQQTLNSCYNQPENRPENMENPCIIQAVFRSME